MLGKKLLWQLYSFYLLTTLLALVAVALVAAGIFRKTHTEEITNHLLSHAYLVRPHISELLDTRHNTEIDQVCKRMGQDASIRITIILASGLVIGDSQEDPSLMGPHSGAARSEIQSALQGTPGSSIRYSHTLKRSMLYTAIPIFANDNPDDKILALVRSSIPLTSINATIKSVSKVLAIGVFGIALLFAIASLIFSRRITKPLEELTQTARRFAQGDLSQQLPHSNLTEILSLTESMNLMAADLSERFETITSQANEREAILVSMREGVLALDREARVVQINQACASMLAIDPALAKSKHIEELIRVSDLQNIITHTIATGELTNKIVTLQQDEPRHINVRGTPLLSNQSNQICAVFVLNDITHLLRLEKVRTDFIANVSHELKTPITSIIAAAETLADQEDNSEDTTRFIAMINRHACRLGTIVEDLLELSRIEQDSAAPLATTLPTKPVLPIMEAAVETCREKAHERQIQIKITGETTAVAGIDSRLLENALVNLIDNAIKYSPSNTMITVQAATDDDHTYLKVKDEGCGIAFEHQSRIFERFYCVDPARSRQLGGTGLGLSIVKHIVQAHGGSIDLTSALDEGCTFTISLPNPSDSRHQPA